MSRENPTAVGLPEGSDFRFSFATSKVSFGEPWDHLHDTGCRPRPVLPDNYRWSGRS